MTAPQKKELTIVWPTKLSRIVKGTTGQHTLKHWMTIDIRTAWMTLNRTNLDSPFLPREHVRNTKIMTAMEPKVKQLKAAMEPKVKQLKAVVEPKFVQLKSKVTPKIEALMKTSQYKQAQQMACKGLTFSVHTCEKILGKDKTKSLIQAMEKRIPASWKTLPPAPVKKSM